MSNETKVGLALIAGIIVIIAGTLWLQGWTWGTEEQEVEAWFREVGPLRAGTDVKLRGVPIGEVSAVTLDHRSTGVIVRMNISSDVILPDDPVVLLSPESLLGDWQAEILPRSRYAFYDYAISPHPGVLPGYSLPDFSRLTAVADRIAENLAVITDRVDLAFTDETAVNIREAIDNVRDVTAQLTLMMEAQGQTVENLAIGLEATTETFQEAAMAASRAFAQVAAALEEGELSNILDNVESMTAEMERLSRSLGALSDDLGGTVASADSSFASLNALLDGLERGEGSLGLLLQDTSLYQDLVLTNSLVQDLLQDFQRNPRRYINLRVF